MSDEKDRELDINTIKRYLDEGKPVLDHYLYGVLRVRRTEQEVKQLLHDLLARSSVDGRPKIVCLCGSTKFKNEYIYHTRRLTLEGNIVLSVGFFGHQEEQMPDEKTKEMLDTLHLRKIDLADEVIIICPGDYIGHSTSQEILYAKSQGKSITMDNTKIDTAPASSVDVDGLSQAIVNYMAKKYEFAGISNNEEFEWLCKNMKYDLEQLIPKHIVPCPRCRELEESAQHWKDKFIRSMTVSQCVYCGRQFRAALNDEGKPEWPPELREHTANCKKHPANEKIQELQARLAEAEKENALLKSISPIIQLKARLVAAEKERDYWKEQAERDVDTIIKVGKHRIPPAGEE